MSEKIFDDKIGGAKEPSSEDSSAEMDVIQSVFKADQPVETSGDLFSTDLFGQLDAKEEKQTPPPPATAAKAAPPPAPAEQPAPDAGKGNEGKESSIKVVTDDDLRQLFEASSPGSRPGQAPAGEIPKAPPPPPSPGWEIAASPEAAEEISLGGKGPQEKTPSGLDAAAEDEVEELGITAPGEPPPAAPPPPKSTVKKERPEKKAAPPKQASAEEIVEQIESKAQVGDMTTVAAGMSGDLLKHTAELIQKLDPSGGDFMSVSELKKLFSNVNVLIQLAEESSERLSRLEKELEKLKKGGK